LSGILELAAELQGRAADKNHFVLRRGKGPFRISRRHVLARNICSLVASVAAHAIDAVAVLAALDILQVDVAVVALERGVAGGMTILAAREGEDFEDLKECFAGSVGVGRGLGPGGGANAGNECGCEDAAGTRKRY